MKIFIKKVIKFTLAGLLPFLIITPGYFYYDPFKVLRPHNDYSFPHVITNRDYVSTEMFLKHFPKEQYNSFIFGSSRTGAFKFSSWRRYLPADAKPFMFDAAGESIYGIYRKVKFLDSLNIKMKNVFILLCRDFSFSNEANHKGHLFIKDPRISGESNLDFQLEFYKVYLNPFFLFCFYSYKISGQFKPYMNGYINDKKIAIDTITNEINIIDREEEISQNPGQYYLKRKDLFYERTGEKTDSINRINNKNIYMLTEIKRILEKNSTHYKVALSPLYEQIKFSHSDMYELKKVFGNNLYDFSGKNSLSELKTNFYEQSHFRPNVADSIFKIIYK